MSKYDSVELKDFEDDNEIKDEESSPGKGVEYMNQEEQMLMTSKSEIQILVVFLSSALHFGNSFTGNSQSPLQQELEAYL